MSTDESDAVLVEHTDAADMPEPASSPVDTSPSALQIVSIGSEDDQYAFQFHDETLNGILSKIPAGWKVAVVSVVGAFRTGKSFLLSWFLRYMHHLQSDIELEEDQKWYEQVETLGKDGFDWRGGSERNTTGIWMWSEPHFIKRSSGEQIAVLLVDTQGMFDHETTMALTASIFGLSTLMSSYQIYNVDKRIQEDNLQQLALFSEYARMAMIQDGGDDEDDGAQQSNAKPFQQIEFLVRDWQHFEEEDGDYEAMEKEMNEYLEKVIAERDAKDLKETREQIVACFEKIACYAFVHPGMAVTKKKYNGEVKMMDPEFLQLLDRYCKKVFDPDNLQPKIINDRELTAVEIGSYIKAYAALFASGAKFPEAGTLLDATAQANNTNAVQLSITDYKYEMDRIAGPSCSNYVKPEELQELHRDVMMKSMRQFKSIATFGNQRNIEAAQEKLLTDIGDSFVVYNSLNESRNPLAGLEIYFFPAVIAFVSYMFRFIADNTCSSWSMYCRSSSEFFGHIFAVVFCFILIVAATKAKQLKESFGRLKAAIHLFLDDGKEKKD